MNFRKRAILYLIRKRKILLILCLLLLMSLSTLIGISFKKSTEKELDKLQKEMASGFLLQADTDNEMYRTAGKHGGNSYDGPRITEEMIDRILSLDGVKDYSVESEYMYIWTDLDLRPGMYAAAEPDPEPDMNAPMPWTEEYLTFGGHTTRIYPCRKGELYKDFRTGALSIIEGRNIEEGDRYKAVTSDWLANENHLSVGDTVTLETKEGNYRPTNEPLKTLGSPIEAEIVGLFHANFNQIYSEFTVEGCYIENIIYTDMDTYIKTLENLAMDAYFGDLADYENKYLNVEFLVKNPAQIDSIIQQIKDLPELDLTNMKLEIPLIRLWQSLTARSVFFQCCFWQ